MRVVTWMAAAWMLAPAGPASAQPPQPQPQPQPQVQRQAKSPYADGTGNSAVDTLNSGQLDRNYTGPWHQVPTHRPAAGPIGAVGVPAQPATPPDATVPQTAAPRR